MSKADTSSEAPTRTYKGVEQPWRDPEILHRLYWHEKMDQRDIAEELGCGPTSVGQGMRDKNVPRRTHAEAFAVGQHHYEKLHCNLKGGQVGWHGVGGIVLVHRLMAVAEWGFEAVRDMHIHHGVEGGGPNNLPAVQLGWANWPGNLELIRNEDHLREHHLKIDGEDREAIADEYENTDISSRDLAEKTPVSSGTVLRIHKEFYGDNDGE